MAPGCWLQNGRMFLSTMETQAMLVIISNDA